MENIFLFTETKLLVTCIISIITFICILKLKKLTKQETRALLGIFINFTVCTLLLYYLKNIFNPIHLFTNICILFSLVSILILKLLKVYKTNYGIFFIIFLICSVSFGYISYTPYWARQHDSRDFYNYQNGGHFGYIAYIFFNNALPNMSPIDIWCFYNPPLFYIISAIFIKTLTLFNLSIDFRFEGLQILSFIYTTIFNIYLFKILNKLNIKKSIIPILLFVGLSPAMIILSGSLNNDILSIALSTIAIYYTLVWYDSDNLKDLIIIALTISLAIMTKISVALIAIAIAIAFLAKIIQNKQHIKKYIKHFIIFAIIALPIGLWFPIKNLILYDVPITYVQSVDESNDANISKYSIFDRFFKINSEHLNTINIDMSKENAEYNLFVTTLKSYIIDEYIDYEDNKILKTVIPYIFYISVFISIAYIVNIIYVFKYKQNFKNTYSNWIYFFSIIGFLQTISYIIFCFKYPFTFTMNFRYIVPTLITFAVFTGMASDNNKQIYWLNNILLTSFSALSIIMFTNIL